MTNAASFIFNLGANAWNGIAMSVNYSYAVMSGAEKNISGAEAIYRLEQYIKADYENLISDPKDYLYHTFTDLENYEDAAAALIAGKLAPKGPKKVSGLTNKKPSFQHGKSDGGPGKWQKETTPEKGSTYQQKVTGAPKDTEYVIETELMLSGKKKFDGYNPETNALIDAKDWDTWPPEGQSWAEDRVVDVARTDLEIAQEVGSSLEYHVPTQSKANQINSIFRREGLEEIIVIVTPK